MIETKECIFIKMAWNRAGPEPYLRPMFFLLLLTGIVIQMVRFIFKILKD